MTHVHITSWLLAIILFFVALGLHNSGKQKGAKIVSMILRVFYLLIIGTGIELVFRYHLHINPTYILKMAAGLWVIATMEFILMRTSRGRRTSVLWIQFAIAFLLALYLGLKLPLGFHPFS
ncbi:YisL family protein [Neobacillus sp. PS3-34]|uniref:YisL family protein n=1 Tax=Neobacillus sp. PS3-34 TaxID=3070678 RepID=UPI0027DF328E|nr:YisL family protein [Neobacillus sp. PS3-34]WML49607.1 YisL family protein [Neobacillus sp. PS3-34]